MTKKQSRQVRIIAGQWRGRKLEVADIDGLRPTPDRIRETLFNWLTSKCPGAAVLDCFAGSGALGIESLSRAAKHVTLIEQNALAWSHLQQQLMVLQTDKALLLKGDATSTIATLDGLYDVVFIDPPYALAHLRELVLNQLIEHCKLRDGAIIYLEWPKFQEPVLPAGLTWLKQKKAGQVHYAIAEWRLTG